MRLVLDTNIVVNAFLSRDGPPASVVENWREGAFELVVSEPVLVEYQRVLSYAQVQSRHRMSTSEIAEVVGGFRQFSVMVAPAETLHIVSADPEDDKFLECAVAGEATCIVSGDAHLLQLKEHAGIPILSAAVFLAAYALEPMT